MGQPISRSNKTELTCAERACLINVAKHSIVTWNNDSPQLKYSRLWIFTVGLRLGHLVSPRRPA